MFIPVLLIRFPQMSVFAFQISSVGKTFVSGTRMLRDILGAFREVYRNSICSDQQDSIQDVIMEEVVNLIVKTESYEGQLAIIEFLEDLSEGQIPKEVYATLCERAKGQFSRVLPSDSTCPCISLIDSGSHNQAPHLRNRFQVSVS